MKSLADGLAEFYAAQAPGDTGTPLMIQTGRPHASLSMGVHPAQAQEAAAFDASRGVPTEYTRQGKPVFRDRTHQKKWLKVHGGCNLDGSYGD